MAVHLGFRRGRLHVVLAPHFSALFAYQFAPFLDRLPQMLLRKSRTTQNYNNCHGAKNPPLLFSLLSYRHVPPNPGIGFHHF